MQDDQFAELEGYKELNETQKYNFRELCVRFLNKPRLCRKKNETFIGSNKRIVVVFEGLFVYYRAVTDFVDLKPEKLKREIPKAGVEIRHIKELLFPPKKVKDKNFFQIIFPRNKLLKFSKQKKNYQYAVEKSTAGTQMWQFSFDYDIVLLPQIEKRKAEELKEMQKRAEAKGIKEDGRGNAEEERREAQQDHDRFMNFMNNKKQAAFEEDKEQTKAKEKQDDYEKREKDRQRLDNAFQSKYQDIWMKNNARISFDEGLRLELELFGLVGYFREKAVENVKFAVNQLVFDPKYRSSKLKQIDRVSRYYFFEDDEIAFSINGMSVKLSCVYLNKEKYPFTRESGSTPIIHPCEPFQDTGFKRKNLEFLAYSTVSDIVWVLKRERDLDIKVPLSCVVEYRGFKALCIADIPININESLMVGFSRDKMSYKINAGVNDNLKLISSALGLKSFILATHKNSVEVFLAEATELHRTIKNPYPESQKAKNREDQYNYLIKFRDLFPIDVDLKLESVNYSCRKLRPEFLYQHYNIPLSAGALLYSEESKSEEDDVDLTKAAKFMREECINRLVERLDRMDFLPLDSQSLSSLFHEAGVNIRYMGEVSRRSNLPHVKQFCEIECMARMCKRIFRAELTEFMFGEFREKYRDLLSTFEKDDSKFSEDTAAFKSKDITDKLEAECNTLALEFLNVAFSSGPDAKEFWEGLVGGYVQHYFKIKVPKIESVPKHLLFHVTIYQLRLDLKYEEDIPVFTSLRPFSPGMVNGFLPHTKIYEFKSSYINRLYQKVNQYSKTGSDPQEKKVALSTLSLMLGIEKELKSKLFRNHGPTREAILLAQMASIELEGRQDQGHLQRTIEKCNQAEKFCPKGHPWQLVVIIQLINAYSITQPQTSLRKFEEAIKLTLRALNSSHPINGLILKSSAEAHLRINKFQEGILLYQSALHNLIQSLGLGHLKTIEVMIQIAKAYNSMEFWSQGLEMLKKAASFVNTSIQAGEQVFGSFIHLEIAKVCLKINKPEQSERYCEDCLRMIDQNYYLKYKVEVLQISMKANYLTNHFDKVLKRGEALFEQLEKTVRPELDIYETVLKMALQAFLEGKKEQYKNYYYKILLAVKYEYYSDKFVFTERALWNEYVVEKAYHIPPAEERQRGEFLRSILQHSRNRCGNVVNWLREVFTSLESAFIQIYQDEKFYSNFLQIVAMQSDEFTNAMQDFVLLLRYFGEYFFEYILKIKIIPKLSADD